ncbi:MAG: SMC-Scp complex subunit ScpB [Deltaproteobacteria bacterium]|nr:SMC-Scp complex subunit ScpB [Deltaproteobacteria bacterium]
MIAQENLAQILESLIFAAREPLTVNQMVEVVQRGMEAATDAALDGALTAEEQLATKQQLEEEKIGKAEVKTALDALFEKYRRAGEYGIELVEVAGGFQFRTKPDLAPWIKLLFKPSPTKLSKPAMETLAIIAYRQPLTRVEVESMRGVDSGAVLKTLLEKDLVKVVGKKDDIGKPALYGTTTYFLELFNLNSIKDIPSLRDLEEIEQEFKAQASQESLSLANYQEDTSPEDLEMRLLHLEKAEQEEVLELEDKLNELRKLEKDMFPPDKDSTKVD